MTKSSTSSAKKQKVTGSQKVKKAQKTTEALTIEVSQHTYQALDHLKTMFAAMATDERDISFDDVINVLVQGFAESLQHDDGCCGG